MFDDMITKAIDWKDEIKDQLYKSETPDDVREYFLLIEWLIHQAFLANEKDIRKPECVQCVLQETVRDDGDIEETLMVIVDDVTKAEHYIKKAKALNPNIKLRYERKWIE